MIHTDDHLDTKTTLKLAVYSHLIALKQLFLEKKRWKRMLYAPPSPRHIKEQVLLRNGTPSSTWVETGTYLGDTTQLLSIHSKHVYSIEPDPILYEHAAKRFCKHRNVTILQGLSEDAFPQLLPTLSGDLNFWLDGHYSAGLTFKGPALTPILYELDHIEKFQAQFSKIVVLVDDVRLFDWSKHRSSGYPTIDSLVDWARKNGLRWNIEHDIFVAKNY